MGNLLQFRRKEEHSEVVSIFTPKKKSRGKVYTKEKVLDRFRRYLEKNEVLPPKTYWYKYPELVDIKIVKDLFEHESQFLSELGWSSEAIEEFLCKKKETFSEILRKG